MKAVIFFVCVLINFSSTYAQTKWEYPIKLGTSEWKSLKTMDEVYRVQQIPANILNNMTTVDVFHAWLELPGRLEILAYNSLQKGFNVTRKRFNVLHELLGRPEVGNVVLEYYLGLNPNNIKNRMSDEEKGRLITDNGFVAFLLSQPEVIKTVSRNRINVLLKKIDDNIKMKKKFEKKEKDPFWIETELILAGRLLDNENDPILKERLFKNAILRKSLTDGTIYSKESFRDIYDSILIKIASID